MPADTRAAAILAAIRERAAYARDGGLLAPAGASRAVADSAEDVPVLLAIADAALKLADDWKAPRVHPRTSEEIIRSACGMDLAAAIEGELARKDGGSDE